MTQRKLTGLLITCFSLFVFLSLSVPQARAQLTSVDVQGAIETDCNGINTAGTVVGSYQDSAGLEHGFILKNGRFTKINATGATGGTFAYGINDANKVVGWYTDAAGIVHGYVKSGATFKNIDFPGANVTNAWTINNAGKIVGAYSTDGGASFHGFIFAAGAYTNVDVPNGSVLTEVLGINNNGQMAGIFDDASGVEHGFTLSSGQFKQVDVPDAGGIVTATDRINDSGEIVGLWGTSTSGPFSGYTRVGKVYTTVMFPGSTETRVRGLNNAGVIVGRYTDSVGSVHGYVGTPQ